MSLFDMDKLLKSIKPSSVAAVTAKVVQKEFRDLQKIKPAGTMNAARLPENRPKNRYINILPYDDNRVKLKSGSNDYINASYMQYKGYESRFRYIATQGPIDETIDDFWQMVWEQDAKTIVALTKLHESGREKCAQYWPETPNEEGAKTYGDVRVVAQPDQHLKDFTVRVFHATHLPTQETREVRQFFYSSWPDFGVPHSETALDSLINAVRDWNGEEGNAPIVHCSAGVGRTGTYMIIDFGRYMKAQSKPIRVFDWVKELREQRAGMVQSEEQYSWCYYALGELLLSELEAIEKSNFF